MINFLNVAAAIAAGLAAIFWAAAAVAKVTDNTKADGTSTMGAGEIWFGKVAVGATMRRQAQLNSIGASFAAIAAALQAIAILA